jgi:ABC-type molybdate transport system permease subunit
MARETVTVMNWMALMLLMPATIILVWKVASEKLKRKAFSSDLITMSLVLGSAVIGVAQLNIHGKLSWTHWALLLIQLLLLVFLWKRLWSPLMQKLRG